ncbi:4a-hydroxytetrahydrobiopterin dehydratase [Thermocrinis minervae]|uniref:4a-hydroxytetrahydrobiopterin dehydratase n=1 Tax=Thermocrinis minervae TaxID=381751 RepID=A0A1M6TCK8_9AQUI|nr:4a-hydroxytetrahydrobiopterin dehydratase [Thermocrinis minervae]SHK54614.1 4a-hydroxytetrahydrobiopterin dehydratase [Thermocrinis minervae]
MSAEGKPKVYTPEELKSILSELPEWKLQDGYLTREIRLKNFTQVMMLLNAIAYLAEAYWHHPDVCLGFKHMVIKLKTHELDAITERDCILAKEIERLISLYQSRQ